MDRAPPSSVSRSAFLEGILSLAAATALVRLLDSRGGWPAALAPGVWIYLPPVVLALRRLSFAEHGYALAAWRRGLAWALWSAIGLLLPFAAGVILVRYFRGGEIHWEPGRLLAADLLIRQALAAVSEELFFRGYLQGALRRAFAGLPRGGPALAILLGAALFSLAHLAIDPTGMRAAVFFPALAMGWLRERTGGLLAPAAFHWLANLLFVALALDGSR